MVSDLEPELLLLVPPERPWLRSGFAFETEADAVAEAMALDPLRDPWPEAWAAAFALRFLP